MSDYTYGEDYLDWWPAVYVTGHENSKNEYRTFWAHKPDVQIQRFRVDYPNSGWLFNLYLN